MKNGRIVEQCWSATIAETARHPYTIGLLRCVPTLDAIGLDRLPTMGDVRTDHASDGHGMG